MRTSKITRRAEVLLALLVFISPFTFPCRGYPQNLYPVVRDGKYGYADGTGKIVIQPAFKYAAPFHDGLARVGNTSDRADGFISADGKLAIDLNNFIVYRHFSEGLCCCIATSRADSKRTR
jgi:WG containing repeat